MITISRILLESRGNACTTMLAVVDDEFVAELQLQDADIAFPASPLAFIGTNTGGDLYDAVIAEKR